MFFFYEYFYSWTFIHTMFCNTVLIIFLMHKFGLTRSLRVGLCVLLASLHWSLSTSLLWHKIFQVDLCFSCVTEFNLQMVPQTDLKYVVQRLRIHVFIHLTPITRIQKNLNTLETLILPLFS